MNQHRCTSLGQQQPQQRRQQRQLARTVVAGQHDGGHLHGVVRLHRQRRDQRQPVVHGIEKTSHLFGRFPFDAHGQAERADFQVGDRAVQYLTQQVGGLRAAERARAVFTAADFLDVVTNSHGLAR